MSKMLTQDHKNTVKNAKKKKRNKKEQNCEHFTSVKQREEGQDEERRAFPHKRIHYTAERGTDCKHTHTHTV